MHADVPLGAGADQVAVAGEEAVGPVGAALPLEQPAEDGQRLVRTPVGDGGAVVPADHQVGALTLADLVLDDRLDHLGVGVVVGLEPASVDEVHRDVVDRGDHVGNRELPLGLHLDDHQRRAVVVGLETALGHLPERYGDQPVALPPLRRRTGLQRDVEDRRHLRPTTAEHAHRVAVTCPRRPPDDRPRLVPLERGDGVPGGRGRDRHGESLVAPPRVSLCRNLSWTRLSRAAIVRPTSHRYPGKRPC